MIRIRSGFRRYLLAALLAASSMVLAQQQVQGQEWVPVTGAENLRNFISGLVAERVWPDGSVSRGEYFADGTGHLIEWGVKFPRRWEIHGDDQICFITVVDVDCHAIERNVNDPDMYRHYDAGNNEWVEFSVTEGRVSVLAEPLRKRKQGGATAVSAAELAAELTNPNTTLGILTTLYDYRTFDGTLPGAGSQRAQSLTFQPSLPYPLSEGRNLFIRPAFPLIIEQPVINPVTGQFEDRGVELGDISFDASMGFSFNVGNGKNVFLAGLAGSIPTATDDAVGSDQWLLGPEFGFTAVRKWGSAGILVYRQWDVGGSGNADTDVTGGQYVYNINLKNGWQITGSPTFSYDHKAGSDNAMTFPLAIGVAKTSVIYGRPWTFSIEYWNYIESPDAFGPDQQIRISIAPIVPLPW